MIINNKSILMKWLRKRVEIILMMRLDINFLLLMLFKNSSSTNFCHDFLLSSNLETI